MLATGRQFVILSPHVALLPGLAIFADGAGAQPRRRRAARLARSPYPCPMTALGGEGLHQYAILSDGIAENLLR